MSLSYYENSFDFVGPLKGFQGPLGDTQTTLWESLLQADMQINGRIVLPVSYWKQAPWMGTLQWRCRRSLHLTMLMGKTKSTGVRPCTHLWELKRKQKISLDNTERLNGCPSRLCISEPWRPYKESGEDTERQARRQATTGHSSPGMCVWYDHQERCSLVLSPVRNGKDLRQFYQFTERHWSPERLSPVQVLSLAFPLVLSRTVEQNKACSFPLSLSFHSRTPPATPL